MAEPEDAEDSDADSFEATEEDKKHRLSKDLIVSIAVKLNKHLRWNCIVKMPRSSTKPRKFESLSRLREMVADIERIHTGNYIEVDDDDLYNVPKDIWATMNEQ